MEDREGNNVKGTKEAIMTQQNNIIQYNAEQYTYDPAEQYTCNPLWVRLSVKWEIGKCHFKGKCHFFVKMLVVLHHLKEE